MTFNKGQNTRSWRNPDESDKTLDLLYSQVEVVMRERIDLWLTQKLMERPLVTALYWIMIYKLSDWTEAQTWLAKLMVSQKKWR